MKVNVWILSPVALLCNYLTTEAQFVYQLHDLLEIIKWDTLFNVYSMLFVIHSPI